MMTAGAMMFGGPRSRCASQQLRIDRFVDAALETVVIEGGRPAVRQRRYDDSGIAAADVKAAGGQVLLDELPQELLFVGVVRERRRIDVLGYRIRVHLERIGSKLV